MPTEKEMVKQLKRGDVSLPPLAFKILETEPKIGGAIRFDILMTASWREKKAKFAVECKSLSTPKAFQDGLNFLKISPRPKGFWPMLFLPFLSAWQLQELEREGISGIDLCGNGVVVVPGKYAIFRSGEKNRFPSSAPIKNIYRKNSSMVGRVFISRSSYKTVQEICAEINQRNVLVTRWDKKPMSLSTVSKSLKTLEEDLVVDRQEIIRLLQPDKLLEKLSENYAPPGVKNRVSLKLPETGSKIRESLAQLSRELAIPVVASGISSVSSYAAMQRREFVSVYCPRLKPLLDRLPGSRADRFPNLELIETEDEIVYFDAQQEGGFLLSSPVQVYLELMTGDKRDQETAVQVMSYIMKNIPAAQR